MEMVNVSTKQVIVIRKDLKIRRGKEIAQACHASLGAFTQRLVHNVDKQNHTLKLSKAEEEWLAGSFRKICVYVNSEQELIDVYLKSKLLGVNCILIEDNGTTEFHGVKTKTCCAIGPDYDDKVDEITGHLPLY
jgi:peptidyl-tRNA hydrolase, PTH2 family